MDYSIMGSYLFFQLVNRFNTISLNILADVLGDINKLILKLYRKCKDLKESKQFWWRGTKLEDLHYLISRPNIKLQWKRWYDMGIGWCAGKWNTIQNPETDPHRHDHLIFDKVAKVIVWSKVFSSTNTTGAIGYPDRKKM